MYPEVFHDGRWTDAAHAVLPAGSIALRYGVSVFEGIRLYRRADGRGVQPFRLADHIRRLGWSLRISRLADPGIAKLPEVIDDLVLRNEITADAYVRVAVSAGNPGLMDDEAQPVLTVTATQMGRKRWLTAGMRLQISAWQRASDLAFPAAVKCIANYAGPRLALLDARAAGFDGCMLTNAAGRLTEAPTAALFLVRGGELRTPALEEGVLPGITRAWVLEAAAGLGLAAREAAVTRTDAYRADEAFLCGTGLEFGLVQSFDGQAAGAWPGNPVTRALINRYFEEVRS